MNNQRTYEVLWSCMPNCNLPHQESFTKFNPNVKQHICAAPPGPKKPNWSNNDRFIRNWFKSNKFTNTLILEYDVFVNKSLDNEPFDNKVLVKNVLYPLNQNHERLALGLPNFLKSYKLYCSVLGVTYLPKEAIEAFINPIYDKIYKQNFHCEMRLFTVLSHAGFRANRWKIPYVNGKSPTEGFKFPPGIHHSVKLPFN